MSARPGGAAAPSTTSAALVLPAPLVPLVPLDPLVSLVASDRRVREPHADPAAHPGCPPRPGGAAAGGGRTAPGATAFTRTPLGPGSTAAERTNATLPAPGGPAGVPAGPVRGAHVRIHGGTLRQI
ncbi:hypothetical protein Snoj_46750 [Streptomyces nojiriensis]|uniref:Uncharacterized protein n=1 Tax=Streptomyces nojiriensis TaxID=66374 RepID=A0ABQ3SS29_9ACTN|nr:hypothetical protein GCM10010205_40180 [Streptomyces nojiriensis]GHI70757.1 hypothetical protein Snoj_46750 [Streptomyces nojiriensis]